MRTAAYLTFAIILATQWTGCMSEAQGRWQEPDVADNGESVFALTLGDDDGSALGYSCDVGPGGQCYLFAVVSQSCDEGDRYNVLMTIDQSTYFAILDCQFVGDAGSYLRIYSGHREEDKIRTEDLRNAWHKANDVALAFPVAPNKFRAVRFDMTGSSRMMIKVEELSEDMKAPRDSRSGYKQPVESGEF